MRHTRLYVNLAYIIPDGPFCLFLGVTSYSLILTPLQGVPEAPMQNSQSFSLCLCNFCTSIIVFITAFSNSSISLKPMHYLTHISPQDRNKV